MAAMYLTPWTLTLLSTQMQNTKCFTVSIRWFCIRIERVMTVYENYNVIAFKSCIQKFTVHVAHPIQQSRQQVLRAYCSKIDTVLQTLRVSRFHTGTSIINTRLDFKTLILSMILLQNSLKEHHLSSSIPNLDSCW
jgi:hypothetical protein